jgi:plastocyanin
MRVRSAKVARIAMLVLAVGLVAAACGKSSNSSGGSPSPSAGSPSPSESESSGNGGGGTITIGSDQANNKGSEDVSGEASVEVEMDDFYFKPTVLTGTPGQKVTLELKNEGSALHNFSLPDQSLDQDVQPDGSGTVSVTFPQSGFLEFFCKFHKATGMVGELTTS